MGYKTALEEHGMLIEDFESVFKRTRLGERARIILRRIIVDGEHPSRVKDEFEVSRQYVHKLRTQFEIAAKPPRSKRARAK